MPEEVLFKSEEQVSRGEIAESLRNAADQIDSGDVTVGNDADEQRVTVPDSPRFEVELERLTDSETGEQRYELEYEIRWKE
ncbi:amphi-Trp domain-containing protein [Halospeciosus flavus]|uniref:Amphi-Trp domain-containing protein n=1 Tax=Halospeciosus flavus TaxID=3032283 RepID=A0ABD5YWQ3_9EURY|nr:amphi-Trp domain-containing protein [Halospeciosus flavus]